MIVIRRNTGNDVALTLTEGLAVSPPLFLFELITDGNVDDDNFYFLFSDLATETQKERFNLFSIVESDEGEETEATNSPIKLGLGQYQYNIYEGEEDNYTPDGNILESGILRVIEGANEEEVSDNIYI